MPLWALNLFPGASQGPPSTFHQDKKTRCWCLGERAKALGRRARRLVALLFAMAAPACSRGALSSAL